MFSIQNVYTGRITLDTGETLESGASVKASTITYATYDLYKRKLLEITPTPIYNSATGNYTPAENLDGIYNASTDTLRILRTAVNNARSGISRAKIGVSGHSVPRGTGSWGGTNGTQNGQIYNFFTLLCNLLKAQGLPTAINTMFASGACGNDSLLALNDPRCYFGNAFEWGETATEGLGGPLIRNNAGSLTAPFRISFADTVDTLDFWYLTTSGTKTVQVSRGGALNGSFELDGTQVNLASGLISQNAATGYTKTTLAIGASGPVTINVVRASGTIAYIGGFDAYLSTKTDIQFYNFSRAGAGSATFGPSANTYAPINAVNQIGLNVIFDMNGINDINNGVPIATHIANREAWLKQNAANGTLPIVLTDPPLNPTTANNTIANQTIYRDAICEMAIRNNWPLGDVFALFKNYISANASGLYYDNFHIRRNGGFMVAEMLSDFFYK